MARGKKTGGRIKGTPNKASKALKDWALEMLEDEAWRQSAKERCIAGKAPHIETHFLTVGLPKPANGSFSVENKDGVTVFRWQE